MHIMNGVCYTDVEEGGEFNDGTGWGMKSPKVINSSKILLECFICMFIVWVDPSTK